MENNLPQVPPEVPQDIRVVLKTRDGEIIERFIIPYGEHFFPPIRKALQKHYNTIYVHVLPLSFKLIQYKSSIGPIQAFEFNAAIYSDDFKYSFLIHTDHE